MFLKKWTTNCTQDYSSKIIEMKNLINSADYIIIGAGAGLSASAGLLYGGERFQKLFPDFIKHYDLIDMYSSAFYPFETTEEYWAYFSKHIYYNRYESETNSCYNELLKIAKNKEYFVITTNADHLFIKSGFDQERIFYMQGDYGLFQCSNACHNKTYDNKEIVYEMVERQKDFKIPTDLIPKCPVCGENMDVNLRKDNTFVEDDGWHIAMNRYNDFVKKAVIKKSSKIVFLELGVGYNTPSIIKYPFWKLTHQLENANYICINLGDVNSPKEIKNKTLSIDNDINKVLMACNDIL